MAIAVHTYNEGETLAMVDWSTLVYPDDAPAYLDDNDRVRTEYSEDGRVNASIDERGNRTEYRYDAVGRLVETIYADETHGDLSDNPRMSITYDAGGRRVAETDALGHTTRYQYDDLGRVTDTIFHDGSRTQVAYDELGRRTSMTDPEGYTTTYQYDALGRLTGVLDALGQLTQYRYDELGRLIEAEDANGQVTAYEYDRLGRRIAVELPLEQRSSMTYDAVGNMVSMTDFNGEVTAYGYDAQNRLILTDYEDDADVVYTYTADGQVATITDGRGITSFDYDHQGRLLSRQDPDGPYLLSGNTIEYSYDEAGNRTSVTTPNGSVTYGYDERNRLTTVLDDDLNLTTYTYDDANNLVRTVFPNDTVEIRRYDDLNRLVELKTVYVDPTTGAETVLTGFDYTLNQSGHRLAVTEADGRQVNYTYDELYRLTEENINGGDRTIAYTYDSVGNRLSRTDSVEGTTTYTYDANDRLLSETLTQDGSTVQTVGYSYDANGNLTSRVQDTNGTTETTNYTWNDDNRLVRAELPNGDVATYEYDSEGIRVSSTVNGETTEYLIDKNRPYAQVLEEFRSEQLQAFYVYGHDLISQERGTDTTFYQVDGLGSTRILTDETGNLTDSYDYEAFGELIDSSGDTENSYRFTGEQFDETLGDYYLRDRFYDPSSGRFLRRDVYEGTLNNPITRNGYLYGSSSPINHTDPTGFYSLSDISAAQKIRDILQGWFGDQYTNIVKQSASQSPETRGLFNTINAIDFVLSAKDIATTGLLVGSIVTNGLKKFPFGIANRQDLLSTSTNLSRKTLRSDIYRSVRAGGAYEFKHVRAKTTGEARSLSIRGLGGQPEASYLPEYAKEIVQFEKTAAYTAVKNGYAFEAGGTRYFFHRFDEPIGYNNGELTKWVRVEMTTGTPAMHSFPANLDQVRSYISNPQP